MLLVLATQIQILLTQDCQFMESIYQMLYQ